MARTDDDRQDPTGWTRVHSAVEEALAVSPEERARLLDARLSDVPVLLAEARAMVAEDEIADDFIEPATNGALSDVADRAAPRRKVGPYEIQRLLARGGMGAVYLAARADGAFQRQVALKLVPPGLGTEEVLARFRRERQVQANLSHPSIAALLDGGATEDGLPYLVMEYVEGERIDRHADENRLSTRERLGLFLGVCDAVAHAHENLVVHRDLKPSNILVTPRGEPKLLDFGIAKLLDPEKRSEVEVTREVMQLMTPAYASPEQLRGRPVTQASDLYSLGVLLYELLTGHLPHALEGKSPAEVERVVCDDEPERPSRAIHGVRELSVLGRRSETTRLTPADVGERRATTPSALARELGGDLDLIVLRCLRKEPQRRYASVRALAEDVERFLAGRPVFARPDSVRYRAAKFFRRNRWPVLVATAVFAALTAGLLFSLRQYRDALDANARFGQQRELAHRRLTDLRAFRSRQLRELVPLVNALPGARVVSSRLLAQSLASLDSEAADSPDDPNLVAELVEAYLLLAGVSGDPAWANAGDSARARETYEKALTLARRLDADPESHPEAARLLVEALSKSAYFLAFNGDLEVADARFEEAVEIAGRRFETHPMRGFHLRGEALMMMCRARTRAGRFEAAREAADGALENWADMAAENPSHRIFIEGLACDASVLRANCDLELGRPRVALETLEETETRLAELLVAHPQDFETTLQTLKLQLALATALEGTGELDRAERRFLAVVAGTRAVAAEGDDARSQHFRSAYEEVLGSFLVRRDRLAEARPYLESAHAHALALVERDPDQLSIGECLTRSELALGDLERREGELLRAAELLGSARSRLEASIAEFGNVYPQRSDLVRVYHALGELYLAHAESTSDRERARGDRETARSWLDRAAELGQEIQEAGLGGTTLRADVEAVRLTIEDS